MDNTFISFADAIAKKISENPQPKFRSKRSELFNELYNYYEKSYKKNAWINYINWLKQNHFKHSKEKIEQFKKDKSFYKQISIKSFCSFWLGFISTNDLYYLVSIARDMDKRNQNFNKWLFYSIKPEKI